MIGGNDSMGVGVTGASATGSPATGVVTTRISATASWRPMTFGDDSPARIADPLFEPKWSGRRTLLEVVGATVAVRDVDLGDAPRTADLLAAIKAACTADELILDGYLVPGPLPGIDAPRLPPSTTAEIKRSDMLRLLLLGSFAQRRTPDKAAAGPPVAELPPDGPLAFIAVDLVWLDGQPLIDLPLGERKRLLESVVVEGDSVRRELGVRAPADRWHGHWRGLGVDEIAVKAANSRYVPGGRSGDWTIVPIPNR